MALRQAADRLKAPAGHVELKPVGDGVYRAKLRDVDATVSVEVSFDGLEARIASYSPPVGNGRPLTGGMLTEALQRAAVVAEPDAEAIAQVFRRLEKGLDVRGTVVAHGIPPRDGTDGRFELACEGAPSLLSQQRDAELGFRERSTVRSAKAGELIARIVPPQRGTPGRSVRGDMIPARDGKAIGMRAGRNVEASADGCEFGAKADGVIELSEGVLSVAEAFEIGRDVDIVMGSVRVEHASVRVKGSVRNGLAVACGGDLAVGEGIENAVVEAGGDVRVTGGIAMAGGGRIRSGGSVFCRFAEDAMIEAGADVVVDDHISNCDVHAYGRIIATGGQGRIQGGTVRCDGGVEANEIGSPFGVVTHVVVGLRCEGHDALAFEREELERTLQRIRAFLGGGDPVAILQRTTMKEREPVAGLLQTAIAARRRLDEIEAALEAQGRLLRQSCQASIKVRDVVHPGSVLTIEGRRFQVQEPIHRSQFHYDRQSDSVRVVPLGGALYEPLNGA